MIEVFSQMGAGENGCSVARGKAIALDKYIR
jgi:hypothetical protein